MNKEHRKRLAEHTLEILQHGRYTSSLGTSVDIAAARDACRAATRLYTPEDLQQLRATVLAQPPPGQRLYVDVVNETTLQGIAALVAEYGDSSIAALNFASARNPGGGFLSGAQAQEESLARSSALYASQLQANAFYERHRRAPSLLYSDAMILSPHCPVFRSDDGDLLPTPPCVCFITAAAPNAGAIAAQRPSELPHIDATLHRRAEAVLALAAAHGYRHLILGAWGCGVFRNDPAKVAATFTRLLRSNDWSHRFERVRFSVYDSSRAQETWRCFREALAHLG